MASALKVVIAPRDVVNRLAAIKGRSEDLQEAGPNQPQPEDPAEAFEMQEVKRGGAREEQGQENGAGVNGQEEAAMNGDGGARVQQGQIQPNAADNGDGRDAPERGDLNDKDEEAVVDEDDDSEMRSLSGILEASNLPVDCCCSYCVTTKTFIHLLMLYCMFVLTISQIVTAAKMCPGELDLYGETIFITIMTNSVITVTCIVVLIMGGYSVSRQPGFERRVSQFTSALWYLTFIASCLVTVQMFIVIIDAFDLRTQKPKSL